MPAESDCPTAWANAHLPIAAGVCFEEAVMHSSSGPAVSDLKRVERRVEVKGYCVHLTLGQRCAASRPKSQPTEEIAEDSPLPFAALSIIYAVLGIAIYVAPHSVRPQQ